jgi:hypothetical protein
MIKAHMRSMTWITILVGLFMFQGVWNVAAAFCVHEKVESHATKSLTVSSNLQKVQNNPQSVQHFGHHDAYLHHAHAEETALSIQSNDVAVPAPDAQLTQEHNAVSQQSIQALLDLSNDDHTDHLPSMGHLILSKLKPLDAVIWHIHSKEPAYFWLNAYQSPDLFQHAPPPEFSPLMVG